MVYFDRLTLLPPDPLSPNQQHLILFLQDGESHPIFEKSDPFQNEVETKVFTKLNTLDLSLVKTFTTAAPSTDVVIMSLFFCVYVYVSPSCPFASVTLPEVVARLLLMTPIEPWPFLGTVAYCTTKIGNFRREPQK